MLYPQAEAYLEAHPHFHKLSLTQNRAGGGFEGLTLQALSVQEVVVGGAGVGCEVAGAVESAQVQEHRPLMVTDKVGLP